MDISMRKCMFLLMLCLLGVLATSFRSDSTTTPVYQLEFEAFFHDLNSQCPSSSPFYSSPIEVRKIGQDVQVETEQIQQKDVKQTAALDLIYRLNYFRSYSDVGNNKALEEWRKRKVERTRQRSLVKNGTASSQYY